MKNSIAPLLVSLAAFCLGSTRSRASEPALTVDSKIESICDELQKKGQLNGVVLIAEGDTIVHHKAYGLASAEQALPHTLNSRFMIASTTKALTAGAVLRAAEQGLLELGKPVATYLNELTGTPAGELTAHELLSHSGGLPSFVKDQMETYPSAQFLAELKAVRLAADGKGKFVYQNENFMLLAVLLEKLYGLSFTAILQQQIFAPAGMQDSGVNFGGKIVDRLAAGYVGKEGSLLYPPLNNLTQTFGAGCVYSSSSDLWRFLQGIARRQVLRADSVNLLREAKAGPYSYGWFTRQAGGQHLMAAPGRMPGYSSLIAFSDDGLAVVVLNNIYDCPVMPLLQRIVAARAAGANGKFTGPVPARQ